MYDMKIYRVLLVCPDSWHKSRYGKHFAEGDGNGNMMGDSGSVLCKYI